MYIHDNDIHRSGNPFPARDSNIDFNGPRMNPNSFDCISVESKNACFFCSSFLFFAFEKKKDLGFWMDIVYVSVLFPTPPAGHNVNN
jgi:hypothetical protein